MDSDQALWRLRVAQQRMTEVQERLLYAQEQLRRAKECQALARLRREAAQLAVQRLKDEPTDRRR